MKTAATAIGGILLVVGVVLWELQNANWNECHGALAAGAQQCQTAENTALTGMGIAALGALILVFVIAAIVGAADERKGPFEGLSGWYRDPLWQGKWRWWDGHQWTPGISNSRKPGTDKR